MDSTERFWNEWISGRLDPVPVVPCLSRDFYVMYRIWANQTGVARPASEPILMGNSGRRTGAAKKVCWYLAGAKRKQATFIFPPDKHTPPDGKSRELWLAESTEWFVEGVADYKKAQHTGNC
jgi:hypothetical protein